MKEILSVVIAAYNNSELTLKCLESIEKQTLSIDKYEVIIVNNNSIDNTVAVVSNFIKGKKNYRLLNEKQQGISFVRNRGWSESNGNYILFVDNDIEVDMFLFNKVLMAFQSINPTPVSIGAKISPRYELQAPDWFSDDFEIRTWGDSAHFLKDSEAINGFAGGCCSFRRDILVKYNGFSSDFGMVGEQLRGGEETDLYNRIYDGSKINNQTLWYDPEIKVLHWVPKEHMTIAYHFRRSFGFGLSARDGIKKKRNIIKYLLLLPLPLMVLFEFLTLISFSSQNKTTRAVIIGKKLAWETGYYWVHR